ncbi:solute:sodium symporter family transporter [Brachybacterium phenoliresistens]|uniref:Transporter n=2 Tax=Brachybacterium phenoliresistens TaxID=396014 RepID=Z9JPS8_9MICO|nr:transporter [Brachybacterium phenoliresistens]
MGIMQVLTFVGFTALVGVLSWWWTRGTDESHSDGYFLGGRSLTAPVIAGSLMMTNLSTEQIVGLNGQAYSEGILVMAWETLAAIAICVCAVLLIPKYLKSGIATIPQFLERRFDTTTKAMVSILFLSGYAIVLLPIVLYSGALAMSTMFDIPGLLGVSPTVALWITVWALGIIGSIYAIFGGLKAVAVSDTINGLGLVLGGLAVPIFGLIAIGQGNLFEGVTTLYDQNPEHFESMGGPESSVPFATIFTGMMLVQLFYWGTNQAIIQRALAGKNLQESQKGLLLAAGLKILGPVMVVLPGVIAWQLLGPDLPTADAAYPALVREVLPGPLLGLFAAVIFGAILSSFNSALNSSVTLFGLDLYKEYINKDASDAKVVSSGKIFGIFLAAAAMIIAPFIANAPAGLFGYLQEVNGMYNIPILTILLVGIFTKYVPALSAKVAIVLGAGLYCISQFLIKPAVEGAGGSYPHFLHVMAILFVLNVVIMLVIGKLRPRQEAYVQVDAGAVDITPWPATKPVAVAIVLVVVAIYIVFA